MKLRKINAALSFVTTVLLLMHAISVAVWMLSGGKVIPVGGHELPQVLAVITAVHAIISIVLAILAHKSGKTVKGKSYPKMNIPTLIQRISGVLMILFIPLHASGVLRTPRVVYAIVPPVFFFVALSHIAVSASKAFITLGIGNAKFVKCADIVVKVVCAATLIVNIIGFYLHVY